MNSETLADILAEMRDTCGDIADHEVVDYADRTEAAVQRLVREERTEAIDEALAHAEEVRQAKCRNCERAPGSAAAMREALIQCELFLGNVSRHGHPTLNPGDKCTACVGVDELRGMVDAALSAPPRNCDRFRTSDEVSAYWAANVHAVPLHGDAYAMRIDGREFATFLDWLFATAEGGAR